MITVNGNRAEAIRERHYPQKTAFGVEDLPLRGADGLGIELDFLVRCGSHVLCASDSLDPDRLFGPDKHLPELRIELCERNALHDLFYGLRRDAELLILLPHKS